MRKLLAILCITISVAAYSQQDKENDTIPGPWDKGGLVSLNFTQVSLTNWAAGGQNSISGNFIGNVFADYKTEFVQWENNLDIDFGMVKQGKNEMRKTTDNIEFVSKYGRQAFRDNKNWYYSTMFSLKTQFAEGYDYPNDSNNISDFMSPGYVTLALGMDYSPNEHFSLTLSPFTGKLTIVHDQMLANQGAYGVDPAERDTAGNIISEGENLRYEYGGLVKIKYRNEIMKNVNLATNVYLFSNYFDQPQNIDINWDMLLSMKVNKFLSVTVNTTLIYDDDIIVEVDEDNDGVIDKRGPRTQFKEVIGIGLTYEF